MGPPVPAMWVHLRVASMIPFFQSLYEPSRAALPGVSTVEGQRVKQRVTRNTARPAKFILAIAGQPSRCFCHLCCDWSDT